MIYKTTIEAVQWMKHGDHPLVEKVSGVAEVIAKFEGGNINELGVLNMSGGYLVSPSDWIIKKRSGEYTVMSDVNFKKEYTL